MIVLGIVLILVGWLLNFRDSGIVLDIGIILLVIGIILFILGSTGHAVRGRRHWY